MEDQGSDAHSLTATASASERPPEEREPEEPPAHVGDRRGVAGWLLTSRRRVSHIQASRLTKDLGLIGGSTENVRLEGHRAWVANSAGSLSMHPKGRAGGRGVRARVPSGPAVVRVCARPGARARGARTAHRWMSRTHASDVRETAVVMNLRSPCQ